MTFRREIGWCVAQAYRLAGARRRAMARCRAPGVRLPVVFHDSYAEEVRGILAALRGVDLVVAKGHLLGDLPSFLSFLGWGFRVGGLVFRGGIIIFTQGEVFLSPLQVLIYTT